MHRRKTELGPIRLGIPVYGGRPFADQRPKPIATRPVRVMFVACNGTGPRGHERIADRPPGSKSPDAFDARSSVEQAGGSREVFDGSPNSTRIRDGCERSAVLRCKPSIDGSHDVHTLVGSGRDGFFDQVIARTGSCRRSLGLPSARRTETHIASTETMYPHGGAQGRRSVALDRRCEPARCRGCPRRSRVANQDRPVPRSIGGESERTAGAEELTVLNRVVQRRPVACRRERVPEPGGKVMELITAFDPFSGHADRTSAQRPWN